MNHLTDLPQILIGKLGRTTEIFLVWLWDQEGIIDCNFEDPGSQAIVLNKSPTTKF